jgi:hypothetical protein
MTRDEWQHWFDDLRKRLPETATYVETLSQETRDEWFDGIFEPHELRDALAVNRKLWESGEGLGKFERDRLPSVFIRELGKQRFEREQREQSRSATNRGHFGAMRAVREDAVMGPAFRYVRGQIQEHKLANDGAIPSDEQVSDWTQAYLNEHDTSEDDPTTGPRYKCHKCRDTGWQNYQSQGRVFCGACPACDAGRTRSEQKWRSGRTLGFAPGEAEENPFNASLAELSD